MSIKPLIKKEFLELVRDYKSLAILAVLPLVMMPTLAIFNTYLQTLETGVIYIDNQDGSEGYIGDLKIDSTYVVSYIVRELKQKDPSIVVVVGEEVPDMAIDVILTIPDQFSYNLTSFSERATAKVMRAPQSPKADRIASQLYSALWALSENVSRLKIIELGKSARIDIDPQAVRDPVVIVVTSYIAPTGETISIEQAIKVMIARLLAFSLIFVATPSITYVVDSILGEKERKTIEILLTTPLSKKGLIAAKAFTSSIVGLFAAAIDVVAVLMFLIILSRGFELSGAIVDPVLLLINGLVVYSTILATLSLSMPVIIRSGTMRTAQISSSVITILASAIFFSVLFVDILKLPQDIQAVLMLIPYTHSVLSIQKFAYGDIAGSFIHIALLISLSIVLLVLSSRILNEEKMLVKPV